MAQQMAVSSVVGLTAGSTSMVSAKMCESGAFFSAQAEECARFLGPLSDFVVSNPLAGAFILGWIAFGVSAAIQHAVGRAVDGG